MSRMSSCTCTGSTFMAVIMHSVNFYQNGKNKTIHNTKQMMLGCVEGWWDGVARRLRALNVGSAPKTMPHFFGD